MNTQTINLTPPINGVQYGISTELIKEGDFYYLQSVTTKNMILKASESKISSNCKKIICSTNPKDLRFPYLQIVCPTCGKREWGVCSNSWHKNVMPSKEQEVETYYKWVEVSKYGLPTKDGYYPVKREDNLNPLNWYIDIAKWNNKPKLWSRVIEWLAPVNANKGIYIQEDMINVAKFATGTYRTEKQIKNYIQSLQPTVKAVRVEMEEIELKYRLSAISKQFNEEDFTKELHKSLEENPNHDVKTFRHQYADKLGIPKYKIKVEASSEHSQGVIKALEVIY